MISKIKYEYLLFFIAVAWVLFFAFVLQLQPHYHILGDDVSYLDAARSLYLKGILNDIRPLLAAALFGLPFLFGFSANVVLAWVFALNFTCWFLTVVLVFKIAASQFNRKTGFLLAIAFLFCIGNLAHAFRFLSESVFIFLLVLSVYFIQKYLLSGKSKYLTIALSVLLFNVLVKPVALGMFVVVLLFFFRKIKPVLLNRFSVLLLGGFGLIFFQMYSLKQTYGDFTISYIGSVTYYNYLGAKADAYKNNIEYMPGKTARTLAYNRLDSHSQKQLAGKDFTEQLQNNKINLAKAYLFCIYSNSSKGNYIVSETANKGNTFYFDFFRLLFKAVSKLQNIVFTVLGVVLSFYLLLKRKGGPQLFVVLSVLLLYIFFISAISCYECDRFHIAFFPFVLLLSYRFYQKRFLNEG